jgi:DNA-directed RNA polymerase subunit beta
LRIRFAGEGEKIYMATTAAQATENRSTASKRIRKIFGNIHEVSEMPNLIEVQRESYEQFLRSRPQDGYVSGLEKTLRSVFPIRDFAGTAELDFVNYELEDPKYDTDECRQRGMTYAAPMRVTLRLIVFEVDPDTETRSVLDIKEQDVYMGDMPLMRNVHRQRHRASHRLADAPFAGRAVRP